jgi:hypothetical protein
MNLKFYIILLSLMKLTACTTIGVHDRADLNRPYTGEPQELRICIYRDMDVSVEKVNKIVDAVRKELNPQGVLLEVPWIRPWDRPSFMMSGIIRDIGARPLEYPCDRLLGVIGRNLQDFAWGLLLPEVVGAVEDTTLTKGYVVGEWGSLNQILSMQSPKEFAIHEVYHLLGCSHGLSISPCHEQVDEIRSAAKYNREQGNDFFPAMSLEGHIFWSRGEVETILGAKQGTPSG